MSARFSRDLAAFRDALDKRMNAAFLDATGVALESVKIGHTISGAPGQPVDTGTLLNSWDKEILSPERGRLFSTADHAQAIEEGVGPYGKMTVRSAVGGFHSVKLTVAAWSRIVSASVEKITMREK